MQKNSFMKLFGVALAATLAFSGCGSSSGGLTGVSPGGSGVAATGGGGTTGGTTGTTGFGLTGGTLTFGGSGTAGGTTTTTTGGTTTTTTGTTTTTTGTTTGSTTFLNPVTGTNFRTGLNNPTAFTTVAVNGVAQVVLVDGFRFGQANGRVLMLDQAGTFNASTGGFPIKEIQRTTASPFKAALTNPFDVVSDGTSLYISAGFEASNEGAIIKISNLTVTNGDIVGTWTDLTANVEIPRNPAFMTLASTSAGTFVYWTEYSSSAGGGRVRRIRTDGTGTADVIINNLNFPAGIDHDGTRLAVCDSAGGGSSLGRVIVANPNPATTLNGQSTDVTEITTANATDQAIRRPFDVKYDGRHGFFFTEGAALASISGPTSAGQGNGAVRFIAQGSTVAQRVSVGLTDCAGIDAVDTNNDGTSAVLFSESVASTGSLRRRLVNTSNVTLASPTTVETGLFSPLAVGIFSETIPSVAAVINYTGGQNNGSVRVWAP